MLCPNVWDSWLLMLCPNVWDSAGQLVMMYVRLWVLVLLYADFVDGVIFSLSESGQRSEMLATKPAEVHSVRTW